ncbi:MAG: xanthine phosphoribosyltransferase [Bacilli bacterium]|nr:xanthine phosphoribosyltransferase [Bacilli bacterium]
MKALEDKILQSGTVIDNKILKVDNFFNYQIDTITLKEVAKYIASYFQDVDKVLTVEASGIAFAVAIAYELGNVPVVFAKKSKTALTTDDQNYSAEVPSYTHNTVNHIYVRQNFLHEGEKILIVDDFMAVGSASIGLAKICEQAKAKVVGVGVGIEKEFQGGRKRLEELNIKVISAARIKEFKDNKPIFNQEEQ